MKKSIGVSLFLIVLGTILLLNNLNYLEISITDIIKDYWPVFIIWMGLEKLIRNLK